jgi:hypothetical protein
MVEIDYAGEVKAGLQYPFKVIAEQGVAIRQSHRDSGTFWPFTYGLAF